MSPWQHGHGCHCGKVLWTYLRPATWRLKATIITTGSLYSEKNDFLHARTYTHQLSFPLSKKYLKKNKKIHVRQKKHWFEAESAQYTSIRTQHSHTHPWPWSCPSKLMVVRTGQTLRQNFWWRFQVSRSPQHWPPLVTHMHTRTHAHIKFPFLRVKNKKINTCKCMSK